MSRLDKLFQLHAEAKAFKPPVGACAGGHADIPGNGGPCKRCGASHSENCRRLMDSPRERLRAELETQADHIIEALKR